MSGVLVGMLGFHEQIDTAIETTSLPNLASRLLKEG